MKRKIVISLILSVLVACFFVACSNDRDALDINDDAMNLSKYMSREEIQNRLDDIGEMYGTQVIIDKTVDFDLITEEIFNELEEYLSLKKEISNKKNSIRKYAVNINEENSLLLNDSSIDDIMPMAAPPSGETYSGSFTKSVQYETCNTEGQLSPAVCTVTIHWKSTDVKLNSVTASVEGLNLSVQINSYNYTGGQSSDPAFSYTGTLYYTAELIKKDTIDGVPEYTFEEKRYAFQFDGTRTTGQK